MVHYAIAFDLDKHIGVAYNALMDRLAEDDWCCFIDGDAMFLYPFFGNQIHSYIERFPQVGLFTCRTNRGGPSYMLAGDDWASDDIVYHRKVAAKFSKETGATDVTDMPKRISGVLMLLSRKVWKEVGGFKPIGMLGVDNNMHSRVSKAGYRVAMMNGVYVYHWYRGGNRCDTMHLERND